ncbi:MAG TPA: UDP-3-O-(3-hydroxymyristoyl)glucosamine N-acyltransferase [Candidatus Polarisedimenticolia bacterium]|nr:UDP-3-O-(3-hydroxymyristoyl)glucosamine N-acyltransferase [Candidatus Polarisedimenticolia bacterium]
MGAYTLGEIASRIGGQVRGDAARPVSGIKPLDQAGPDDLSFVAHARYRRAAAASRAAGLIAGDEQVAPGRNLILVEKPYAALAVAMGLFHAPERPAPGISPQALLGEGTTLGRDVSIGPYVVAGRNCRIGDRAALMPGVVLGDGVQIGEDSVLHPGVVVYGGSILGARVVVHASSVLGSDGFGYAEESSGRVKIPQVGNVVVGDDVEIGASVTIDRATFGSTVVGRGTKIDNLVQIAHNVTIGEESILVAQSGIAGSTRLGRAVILAGQAGVAGHLEIGDRSVVGAKSAALQDLPAGSFVVGHPAVDHREWKRSQAALRRLPELVRAVARLGSKPVRAGARRRRGPAGSRGRS